MAPFQYGDLRQQILLALAAWRSPDVSRLADTLSEEVVFSSPATEWIDASGVARGKAEVLNRLEEERGSVGDLELIDVLIGPQHITVLLKDGERALTCLVELDQEGKFCRLIPSIDAQI